jgi:hypothetical protein
MRETSAPVCNAYVFPVLADRRVGVTFADLDHGRCNPAFPDLHYAPPNESMGDINRSQGVLIRTDERIPEVTEKQIIGI